MFRKPTQSTDSMMQAALMAAIGGNTQEHTEVNTHTQAIVPLIQAALLSLSLLACFCGLWLLGGGLVVLVRSADSRLDSVLTAGLLWLIVGAWLAGGSGITARLKPKSGLVARLMLLLIAVTGTLATFDVIRLATGFDWLGALRLFGGLALVIGSSFLVWRFGNELVNPLYPSPPIIRLLQEMIHPQQVEPVVIHEPTPYRTNGNMVGDVTPEPPDPDAPHYVSDHELLIAFVERAATIGLQRTRWLAPGAPEYLCNSEVTRGTYNKMIALAAKWEIVRPGGGGKPAEWNMDAGAALERLRLAWESVNG